MKLSRMVVIVASVFMVLAWAGVIEILNLKWHDAINGELRQNTNLTRALQEQTVRVLATADQATLRMRDLVLSGEFNAADFKQLANETGLVPEILTQLSLIGPDGRLVGSNLDPTGEKSGHVNLSEREHFKVHTSPDEVPEAVKQLRANGLFVGKPVLGKVSNKWTVQLSRKIERADGTLLGVIVASLNPSYFEQVYQGVDLGENGGVTLIGDDRTIRTRVMGGRPIDMGRLVPGAPEEQQGVGAAQGSFVRTSRLDQMERIYSYRRVADYPLIVYVSTSTEAALADWRSLRNVTLLLMSLFTLAIAGAAVIFLSGVRQLEEKNHALEISEAQAQAANRAKTEFLAAISHELRTPLTSIRGFAELMEMSLPQPRQKEQAGMIRKGAEHLNALLSEILDMVKVEAGAMPVNVEPVLLRDLLAGTVQFFSLTAADKGLSLELDMQAQVPATLQGDSLRLKQILNNLLSNALKFTQQGRIVVQAEVIGKDLLVHVIDTGPGIPAELHELIFEKFRQGNDRVSYEHGGTGLGLALSRALAELMGGRLTLKSAVGEGSRFTLQLPIR
jgi:signal transduction histidine kinase